MDPISFPLEIKEYFLQNPIGTADEKELINIFKDNAVKETFIAWARNHQSVVEYTPRLYKTLDLATNPSIEWEGIAKTINSLYLWGSDDGSLTLINKILTESSSGIVHLPKYYAVRALELFESGIIDFKNLVILLSIKTTRGGSCPLFDPVQFKKVIPYLDKLNLDDLSTILAIENKYGYPMCHSVEAIQDAKPLLEKLDPNARFTLLSKRSESGYSPLLHDDGIFKIYSDDLLFLLKEGRLPLHDYQIFMKILPSLNNLPIDTLNKLFSIRDNKGCCPLHYIFVGAIPYLEKLKPSDCVTLLSIKDNEGWCPLHHFFVEAIPLLEKLEPSDCVTLLSLTNSEGKSPLHYKNIFKKTIPLLAKLPEDSLNQLFSVKYKEGNTLLHDPLLFGLASPLLSKIKPEVFQIQNDMGISVEEMMKYQPSMQWLLKDKVATYSTPLSEEEYHEKANQLKRNPDDLWSSFVFGDEEGNIPKEYLMLKISDVNKTFTPEEIKEALDKMIGKIINKTVWLGTPREENKEELHKFYSQMLTNFEQVIAMLAEKDPKQKAGTLISIAKTELEERCAAAYQSEIEQTKMVLDSNAEGVGLEANFNKLASAFLIGSIENIVRRDYEGDSHAFNQLLFSVGMAPFNDPLSMVDIADCQQQIIAEWTKDRVIPSFNDAIGRLSVQLLQQWFELSTPDDYGQEFLLEQPETQQQEQKIVNDAKLLLQAKGLEDPLIHSALEIFQSTQGMTLSVNQPKRTFVSEAVFEKLENASTLKNVEEAQALFYEENQGNRIRRQEVQDHLDELNKKGLEALSTAEKQVFEDLTKERTALQQKSMRIIPEFNFLKEFTETKIELEELLKKTNPDLTKNELETILAVKKTFDDKIRDFADDAGLEFDPTETGLPSRVFEKKRREAYAAQFFREEYPRKINHRGAIDILLHIGVLEK